MALHTYLPQDRLRALAKGEALPDRANGTALFADISGFTKLTQQTTHELGALSTVAGLYLSFHADLAAGPSIVTAAIALFGVSFLASPNGLPSKLRAGRWTAKTG